MGILTAPAGRFLALPLTLVTAVGQAFAQQPPVELGAFGTLASFAPSYDLRMGLGGGGRIAYYWRPEWAVEVELGAGSAPIAGGGRTVPVVFPELHALRTLHAARRAWFVLAGYARPGFRGAPLGRFSDDAITLGLGHRAALAGRLALRTELRGMYTFSSGRNGRGAGHLFASVGLSFHPGIPPVADADSDGIGDRRDRCPRTPDGAVVDAGGCPTDSDGDGRLDGLDRCPNTPAGVLTDTAGCPVDSDRDGVYDGVDQCPGSSEGSSVDLRGCPLDSDGDGVNDAADRCPRSPPSAVVDVSGCPVPQDADGDGVDDARDRCPGTTSGTAVDVVGCQRLFPGRREPLVLQGVTFERGSARPAATSFVVLDQVAASLLAHPEVRIEIAGYTDSSGSSAINTRLSAARAGAVRASLRQRGVPAERMRAAGYGPANPVASNATPEGRARNRRVELHQVP